MIHPDRNMPVSSARPAFDELGRLPFAEHSLESMLEKVTELAAGVLPGAPVTSVTIVARRPTTVAASGRLATQLDELQYRLGGGPCLSAATTGQPALVVDTQAPSDWAEFAGHAAGRGCASVLSFPLPVQERVSGALNVYSRDVRLDDRGTVDLVARFAAYAVVPVSNMYLYRSAVERAEHLAIALGSRAVIDQAKGILMERMKVPADRAFQVLARVSMERNVKVREVAQQFVESGELGGL